MKKPKKLKKSNRPSKNTTTVYEVITPAKAKWYLQTSWVTQRRIDEPTVLSYAQIMRKGGWCDMPGIAFDQNGQLVDGHHRLNAIIRSGAKVRLMVTRGLSKAAILALDVNRRRSVAFQLKCAEDHWGVEKMMNKSSIISYVNMCNYLLTTTRVRISHESTFRRFHHVFRDEVAWAISECLTDEVLRHGTVGGALAFAYAADPEAVKSFTALLKDGSALGSKHPAKALLLHLKDLDPTDHSSTYRLPVAMKVLNALLAFINKKEVRALKDNDNSGRDFFSKAYLSDEGAAELFAPWMPKRRMPKKWLKLMK
jgi:hypothetical protein